MKIFCLRGVIEMKKFCIGLVMMFLGGYSLAKWHVGIQRNKKLEKLTDEVNKFREFYGILNYWLTLKEERKNLEQYFENHGYQKIAIYGMKDLGTHLYKELKDTSINVQYGMDKNADCIYADIDVFEPNEKIPQVDVIVVTAVHYLYEIEKELQQYTDTPIVSLADILNEV